MNRPVDLESIILGGGCFWCLEAAFRRIKGVVAVKAGYAGGLIEHPNYEDVSNGQSGHAEVVRVRFNPEILGLSDLLLVFFAIHDPTTRNRQGNDVGEQYRSVIFCEDDAQLARVRALLPMVLADIGWPISQIKTEIKVEKKFYLAEVTHQEYYEKNPKNAYCQSVIAPKLRHLQERFGALIRAE